MKRYVIDPLVRGITGFAFTVAAIVLGRPVAGVRGRWSALPLYVVSSVLSALIVFLVWSGGLYPLRPGAWAALGHPFTADPSFADAWGGPTLIGAWFVHAMVALGMQLVCLLIIRVLNRLAGAPATRTA